MKPRAVLEIHADSVRLIEHDENGISKTRQISPDGLAQAVANDFRHDTGIMPSPHGVVRMIKKNASTLIVYQIPETRRRISYQDEGSVGVYKNVLVPSCVFIFILNQHQNGEYMLRLSHVYAAKGPILITTDTLYRQDSSNVQDDANICWGGHSTAKQWRNLAGISGFVEQFFSSNFNAHLENSNFYPLAVQTPNGRTVRVDRVHSLIKHLDGVATFPYEILKPLRSVASIIQNLEGELR